MKKRKIFSIGMAILMVLAGCGKASTEKMGGEVSSSSTVSVPDNSSNTAESSGSTVKASSQISEASAAASLASGVDSSSASSESAQPYSIRMISTRYDKNGVDLKAEYPQLVGSKSRYAGVNSQLEKEALSTIHLVQANSASAGTSSEMVGRIEYGSPDFVSAVFESSYKTKDNAHTSRALRTVNYDLSSNKYVMPEDIIVNNTALYKAADAAVKKQLSKGLQVYFTQEVLEDSLDQAEFYFKKDGMVVSFTVLYTLGDHAEISIPYKETLGFRTDSSVWSNFSK
nr:RsiV family protein [uncultured Caproiciproducens sp.]